MPSILRMSHTFGQRRPQRCLDEKQMSDDTRETAWLIETGDHMYWDGKKANSDGFTHDPNDAVRFARFEDSERIIHWLMEKDRVFLVSRQHVWINNEAQRTVETAYEAFDKQRRSK